jgi:hypothetical protein
VEILPKAKAVRQVQNFWVGAKNFSPLLDIIDQMMYNVNWVMKMVRVVGRCPVCGGELFITQLSCGSCRTRMEGRFPMPRFCQLDEEQAEFLEVFLRCRGVIKEVERELGVSYPTVKAKLDSLLSSLGLLEEEGEDIGRRRMEVIEELEGGRISAQEAIKRLKELRR